MTPHVSTIGQRHRKEPITPEQRQQIEARFAELQRERPLFGAYARLRKGGITRAVCHGWVGNSSQGRRLRGYRAAAAVARSPILRAKRTAAIAKARLFRWPQGNQAARQSMDPKGPLSLSSSLNTINVEDTTTPQPRLRFDITQTKCETSLEKSAENFPRKKRGRPKKVVQELPKEVSRLTNQTRFARTNKMATW